ncbi:MAG: radical SAM protein [Bacillota bacterium]
MKFLINNPQYWRNKGINEELSEEFDLEVDKKGEINLPEEIKKKLSISPGTELTLSVSAKGIFIERKDPLLTKVYIEPTSDCNLNCKTCVRHSWKDSTGSMDWPLYKKIIKDLNEFESLEKISFWGIGEPLYHPDIVNMVAEAKKLDVQTQIITNALLLDKEMAEGLLEAGLDSIVVSVDGTSPETMADIRSGADLSQVIENVKNYRTIRDKMKKESEIGIEFVIMRSNVDELKNLRKLAFDIGASFIFLTNLLPYTENMQNEILYPFSISRSKPENRTLHRPEIYLPPTDLKSDTINDIIKVTGQSSSISTAQVPFDPHRGFCKFVEEGSIAVNWKGEISPCIALMHSYECYIRERKKNIRAYSLGNLKEETISDIWNSKEFKDFRLKIKKFPFSDCTQCSGCEMSKTNEKDCHGNTFPVCGDCLWARGVIQCP